MNMIEAAWQSRGFIACLLWPLSWVMRGLVALRRLSYRLKLRRQKTSPLPVVVVGNLSVGGTGKSPLTAALVELFQEMDWRPGIVARGYGGSAIDSPQRVTASSDPKAVGDEPVMLAKATGVPVCVCRDRAAAVAALAMSNEVDIVFSDDGLQHYRMGRDVEIAVVDERRGFANGWLLPAGPLREPLSRLKSVDLVALHRSASSEKSVNPIDSQNSVKSASSVDSTQSTEMKIPVVVPLGHFRLQQTDLALVVGVGIESVSQSLGTLAGKTVNAVAGIGDPERFFRQLTLAGMQVNKHPKPDHHEWVVEDLTFENDCPIVITSKDAVKVRALLDKVELNATVYEVRVKAVLDAQLSQALCAIENRLHNQYRQPSKGVL